MSDIQDDIDELEEYPKLKTVGFDARFPNQNQVPEHLIRPKIAGKTMSISINANGSAFKSLCPTKWVERWDEQREANIFPALVERQEKSEH